MKKMRQIVLPLAILFIGAGSAYATNVASKSAKAEIPGWKIDSENPSAMCVLTEQQCTTDNTGFVCTVSDVSGVHDLYQTGCETELFRIP